MRRPAGRPVLIVGAGALGGPMAMALAAQQVPVRVVDDDTVEVSNLPRQIQFRDAHLGRRKVDALREVLLERGAAPDAVEIEAERFTTATAQRLTSGAGVIVDASDSPTAKFLTCDTALAMGLPYVIAAAIGERGNVFVGDRSGACYRCLFEAPPDDTASCASAGVLAPVCGMVASYACAYVRDLLAADVAAQAPSHPSRPLAGTLAQVDLTSSPAWRELHLTKRGDCACARRRRPLAVLAPYA